MAHPAKYSSKLIRRIYEHILAEGWVRPGDQVLDPFGGVALGALDAMRLGLNWTGNELELKFQRLGQGMDCPGFNKKYFRRYHTRGRKWNELNICPECAQVLDEPGGPTSFFGEYQRLIPIRRAHRFNGNVELWKLKGLPGDAILLHGDSRKLLDALGESVQVSVSSPPFSGVGVESDGRKEALQKGFNASGASGARPNQVGDYKKRSYSDSYGSTPGQLGAMKTQGFEVSISSPPFLQSEGGTPEPKPGGVIDAALYARHAAGNKSADAYGESDGQLSSMKDGSFVAAVSSPPYSAMQVEKNARSIDRAKQYEAYNKSGGGQTFEGFCHTQELHSQGYGHSDGQLSDMPAGNFEASVSSPPYDEARVGKESGQEHCGQGDQYGETDGQLGGSDDFWLAARAIVEQVYQALTPGGHAVWVCKDYVKAKHIVPFSDQWRQLCEAVGFVTLHEHHAMLVHHRGTQHTLDGGEVTYKTESKSFFRRLAEKKGSPRIDWETIYCMEKPCTTTMNP